MELPWSNYLYALATLAITFTGFCSIVLVLRPHKDVRSFQLHRLFTRGYIELGFTSAAAAMLPPLLAACGLSQQTVWRSSSAIIAGILILHTVILLRRVIASKVRRFRGRAVGFTTITVFIIIWLICNAVGVPAIPGLGAVVVAATWRLVMGCALFMISFEDFLEPASHK